MPPVRDGLDLARRLEACRLLAPVVVKMLIPIVVCWTFQEVSP